MSQFKSLKEECYEANMQLPKLDLVIYTFGNVSAVDRKNGVFAIKPSGVPYEVLKAEDIVLWPCPNLLCGLARVQIVLRRGRYRLG